jgi:cytochrome b pre-mRNA-processing protein 3
MIINKHKSELYNILLTLSRNIFFYKNIKLPDNFETRLYLIFVHLSILMIIYRNRNSKFNQNLYDSLFYNIENDQRELGFGDVTVNKKMKEFNKISYDILLKINKSNMKSFEMNFKLISSYFMVFDGEKCPKYIEFSNYFSKFYKYCFGLPLDNMLSKLLNFKY